jgi:MFS superfamily sulfate permease-like transporter
MVTAGLPDRVKSRSPITWLPGLANFRGYRRSWLRSDMQAGVSVAAYLVPQALAYAALAGLNPVAGLWAALPPLLIYALLGTSRQLSVGPESTTALMTAAVLAPVVLNSSPGQYASCAATLALLVGLMCFVAGVLRLGFVASLLSKPMLVGYLTGIAVVMVVGQLGRMTGIAGTADTVVGQLRSLWEQAASLHWPTVLLSVSVLAVVMAVQRWAPRLPGPLIGVLGAATVVAAWSLCATASTLSARCRRGCRYRRYRHCRVSRRALSSCLRWESPSSRSPTTFSPREPSLPDPAVTSTRMPNCAPSARAISRSV